MAGQVWPKVSHSCSQNLAGAATGAAGLPSLSSWRLRPREGFVTAWWFPQGSRGKRVAFVRSGLRTRRHSFQLPILAEAVTEVPRFNERGQTEITVQGRSVKVTL